MFSAIPAGTTFAVNSPAAQAATLDQVSKGLRTNNDEQLEARSVAALKETAESQRVHRRNEEEERPKRQAEERTSFQSQKRPLTPTQQTITRAATPRAGAAQSIDILA